jgi:MraZ protein
VLPPEEKVRMLEKVREVKLGDKAGQAFLQSFFAMADSFGCDKQGRITVNQDLTRHAAITKGAVLVGNMIRFAIWNPERWDAQHGQTKGEIFGDLMRQLDF